jgi:hypothetical protein
MNLEPAGIVPGATVAATWSITIAPTDAIEDESEKNSQE